MFVDVFEQGRSNCMLISESHNIIYRSLEARVMEKRLIGSRACPSARLCVKYAIAEVFRNVRIFLRGRSYARCERKKIEKYNVIRFPRVSRTITLLMFRDDLGVVVICATSKVRK